MNFKISTVNYPSVSCSILSSYASADRILRIRVITDVIDCKWVRIKKQERKCGLLFVTS